MVEEEEGPGRSRGPHGVVITDDGRGSGQGVCCDGDPTRTPSPCFSCPGKPSGFEPFRSAPPASPRLSQHVPACPVPARVAAKLNSCDQERRQIPDGASGRRPGERENLEGVCGPTAPKRGAGDDGAARGSVLCMGVVGGYVRIVRIVRQRMGRGGFVAGDATSRNRPVRCTAPCRAKKSHFRFLGWRWDGRGPGELLEGHGAGTDTTDKKRKVSTVPCR
jgi:hypothetical protein